MVLEEKKFKHSPWAGADNSLRSKFLCQQEDLITMVTCCKFKKNIFNLTLYTSFHDLTNVYSCRSRADNHRGHILMSTETSCRSVICYKFQKLSLKSDFIHFFFHDFIHVYSPKAGADNPWG